MSRLRLPRALLTALLLVGTACRPGGPDEVPVTPPGEATPPPGASTEPGPGDAAGPELEPGDQALEALRAEAPRTREKPGAVEGRDAALKAVAAGNPEGAASALKSHLATKPDDLEARLALARALRLTGEYDEALKVLSDKKGSPGDAEVLRQRARLMRRRGDLKGARKLLEGAAKDHPKSLAVRGDLIELMVAMGEDDSAAASALIDLMYDTYGGGSVSTAADLLAVARGTLATGTNGGFKDANMVLHDAERAAPAADGSDVGDEVVLLHAKIFVEKYAAGDAEETLALTLQRDPWHPEALATLAMARLSNFQLAAASRSAREALQVNPRHPDAHAVLARIALIEGRRDEAETIAREQVLAIDAAHPEGLAVLATAALVERRTKDWAKARDTALASNPKSPRFYNSVGDLLGFLHLYPEADTVLAEGVQKAPKDPYVNGNYALNLMRLGNEEKGREHLEIAWKRDKFNERTFHTRKLYRDRIESAYGMHRKGKTELRVPVEKADVVLPVFEDAAKVARKELGSKYGFDPGQVRLEIYASSEEFSVRTVGTPNFGALGVCFGPVITLLGPFDGVFNFDQVVYHELAHTFAIELSKGRVPRWFTEGLSEWESEVHDPAWARESAELLRGAQEAGKLRKLSELELAFLRAENSLMMEVAYATATYVMRYLGTTYGRAKIIKLLEGYATGASTEELFPKVLGKDLLTVEKEFDAWFEQELDRRYKKGWAPRQGTDDHDPRAALFDQAGAQLQAGDLDEASRTLEKLIQNGGDGYAVRMGLASILRQQGKLVAARTHYEKAIEWHREAVDPLAALADLARESGDLQAEKHALERALAIDAMSFDPAARLLVLGYVSGDKAQFERGLDQCVAIAPLHPMSLAGLAVAAAKKDKARAKALMDAIGPVEGGPMETVAMIALAAEATGNQERAKSMAALAKSSPELHPAVSKRLESIK